MAVELFANQAQTTITVGGTTAPAQGTSESWNPAVPSGFPVANPTATPPTQFRISDPAAPSEKMIVTDSRTIPWTVTRGAEGTTPVAHTAGFSVQQVVTAAALGAFLQAVLDTAASDVQALGTQAAGSTGKAADAGHVHPPTGLVMYAPAPSNDATGATDTAALQNALNALPSGWTLRLRSGTTPYWVNAPITYRNGQSVVGEGYAKSQTAATIRQAAGANMVAPGTPPLNGRGVWVSGTAYAVNDAVLIPVIPGPSFYSSATDKGNFAASTAYVVNNVVFNPASAGGDNLVYICIAAYTSSATTPNNDTAHWKQVATALYRCFTALTSTTTPDTDSSHWSPVQATGLLVSYEWLNNNAFNSAPAIIENVQLDGNRTGNPYSTCCGVIMQSFWSEINRCMLTNIPLHGVMLTDTTTNGTVLSSAGSENKITRCKFWYVTQDGFRSVSGHSGNNEDGFFTENFVSGTGLSGANIDCLGGWQIRGNHLYGIGGNGIAGSVGFATKVIDNYIEDFGGGNAPGYFYSGIGVSQVNGRASHVSRNFVGSLDPAVNSSFYQMLSVGASPTQASALAIITDNSLIGPPAPAGSRALVLQNFGSGSVLTAVVAGNQVASVSVESYIQPGVIVSSRVFGSTQFLGPVIPGVVTLTDAAPTAIDASQGSDFRWVLGGSHTLAAPSNPKDGQDITVAVQQPNAGGPYTPAFTGGAGGYTFGSAGAPLWSTAANAVDIVGFKYYASKNVWIYIGSAMGN